MLLGPTLMTQGRLCLTQCMTNQGDHLQTLTTRTWLWSQEHTTSGGSVVDARDSSMIVVEQWISKQEATLADSSNSTLVNKNKWQMRRLRWQTLVTRTFEVWRCPHPLATGASPSRGLKSVGNCYTPISCGLGAPWVDTSVQASCTLCP